ALALGALALFDDDDIPLPRREARIGGRKVHWPDHPLFYLATGLFVIVTLPQLVIDSLQLQWSFSAAGHAVTIPGVVVMLPYIAGFIAYFVLITRVRYKAPLFLNIAATLCGLATL